MASQEQPDLTSVLQTLASYSQPKQPNQHGIALNPTIPFAGSQNVSHPFNGQTIKPKSQESIPRVDGGAIRPTIDPRTITTWPPALRYVMQAVAQNKETMDRVRHLIKLQHDHEKEWFSGRQRVVEMQKQRVVGGKRVDEILKAVGGSIAPTPTVTAEEEKAELHRYDCKVHKACTDMYTAMEAELSGLKIPFFCIDKRLLGTSMENREPREIETGTTIGIEDLRKKMCQLLEDLCRD